MKEDLKNKITGIKSTVKDAFNKGTDAFNKEAADKDIKIKKDQPQSQTDLSKKVDPLVRDKGLSGGDQRKAS